MSFHASKIRTLLLSVLLVLVLLPLSAAGATNLDAAVGEDGFLYDDTWLYTGYTYGGVTFAVPSDSISYEVGDEYQAAGIILIIGDEDYLLQLRRFEPEAVTYEQFKEKIMAEPSADVRTEARGDGEIFCYRNTNPGPDSELFGIAMAGSDGALYKISIFTGAGEAYGADAPVWKIADIIAASAHYRDFSEWGVTP